MTSPPAKPQLDILRELSGRVGGQTAGQVIQALLYQKSIGINLVQYGVAYIQQESIPLYQVCHKGEEDSPAVDWDKWLFVPTPVVAPLPPANTMVGYIRHS